MDSRIPLYVENILIGTIPSVGKFAPAALGRALTGETNNTLQTPTLGAALLALYAATAIAVGWFATTRRDFA